MSPGPARRLDAVLEPVIPVLGELIRAHPHTLSLAQGMVNWGPPPAVAQALQTALQIPLTGLDRYGATYGDPALLEQIAAKLRRQNDLDLDGAALLVTGGSNMAFQVIVQAICEPGSEVILPLPFYFNHVMAVQLAGGQPVAVAAGAFPDPQQLAAAITPRTRAIVTVSPNNPSGVVMPPELLRQINQLCAERGLFHISDEAYEVFVQGATAHASPGAQPGAAAHTISLYSLSKAYGMAGWRIGYGAVPRQLLPALAKVLDTVQIAPPLITQLAARAALAVDPAWCQRHVASLAPRRRQLLAAVAQWQQQGLPVRLWAEPDGAFYGLLVVEGLVAANGSPLGSDALMRQLVERQGVAAVSGRAFGFAAAGPQCLLRLSYGMLDGQELATALERLEAGLRGLLPTA
jgi:aspartate/methionine/tyrosine aminotransferase